MSDKSNVNQIPQHEIDALARCLLPDLIAFYGKYNLTIKKKNNFNGTRAKVLPCAYIAAQSAYLQSNAIISIYQKRKCNL